jgi:hypothetical protein
LILKRRLPLAPQARDPAHAGGAGAFLRDSSWASAATWLAAGTTAGISSRNERRGTAQGARRALKPLQLLRGMARAGPRRPCGPVPSRCQRHRSRSLLGCELRSHTRVCLLLLRASLALGGMGLRARTLHLAADADAPCMCCVLISARGAVHGYFILFVEEPDLALRGAPLFLYSCHRCKLIIKPF